MKKYITLFSEKIKTFNKKQKVILFIFISVTCLFLALSVDNQPQTEKTELSESTNEDSKQPKSLDQYDWGNPRTFTMGFDEEFENYIQATITKHSEQSFTIEYSVKKWAGSFNPNILDETKDDFPPTFFSEKIDDVSTDEFYKSLFSLANNAKITSEQFSNSYHNRPVVLSSKSNYVALYSKGEIHIFSVKEKNITRLSDQIMINTGKQENISYDSFIFIPLKTISISDKGKYLHKLFFSGDESEFYFIMYDNKKNSNSNYFLYKDEFSSNQQPEFIGEVNYDAFPLSNSKGYAVFVDNEKTPESSNLELHFPNFTRVTEVNFFDGYGNLLLSPDNTKACFEGHISASTSYELYDLQSGKTMTESGKQYSYCQRWLNAQEILVSKLPYFNSGGSEKLFLFNTNSKQFTYIHDL